LQMFLFKFNLTLEKQKDQNKWNYLNQ